MGCRLICKSGNKRSPLSNDRFPSQPWKPVTNPSNLVSSLRIYPVAFAFHLHIHRAVCIRLDHLAPCAPRPPEELAGVVKALNGEYVLPAVGGDLLRDGPGVLPTVGRKHVDTPSWSRAHHHSSLLCLFLAWKLMSNAPACTMQRTEILRRNARGCLIARDATSTRWIRTACPRPPPLTVARGWRRPSWTNTRQPMTGRTQRP